MPDLPSACRVQADNNLNYKYMKNLNYDHFPSGKWRRTLFIMKLKLVLLACSVGSLAAAPSFSQEKKVDVSYRHESLVSIFNDLKAKTGYQFFFQKDLIPETAVSLSMEGATIEEIIARLLPEQGLTYTIHGNVVVISRNNNTSQQQNARTGTVTGTVMDAAGNPMTGVAVVVKGTNNGTPTGADGSFTLPAPVDLDAAPVLQLSFIGYMTQEVPVTSFAPLNIVMQENAMEVEEVVVQGYFQRTKQSVTGAGIVMSGEELRQVGSLNLMNALSVLDPSVRMLPNNEYGSDPNKIPELVVRGENSFDLRTSADDSQSNPNSPLWILDGIEVTATRVYDLDMNRIESIEILKDASATALYGSRGANGVVLVQTVPPKEGELRTHFTANYDLSFPDLRQYNLMNAVEKLAYEKAAGRYNAVWMGGGTQEEMDFKYNEKLKEVARGVDTYWLSRPLRTSLNQRYSAFIEGGDRSFRYGISLNYDNDKGVMKGSDREKIGANFNFRYNISDKLRVINDISVDNVDASESPYGTFRDYARLNPYERIYDPVTGEMIRRYGDNNEIANPLIDAGLPNYDRTEYTEIRDNLQIDWRPSERFMIRGRGAITYKLDQEELFMSPRSTKFDGKEDAERGEYTTFDSKAFDFEGNVTAQYNNYFAGKFSLSVGVGMEVMTSNSQGNGYTVTGFISDKLNLPEYALQFKKDSKPEGLYDKSRLIGFLSNLNIGYDNRYFIDASLRMDGSSRFGRDSRFAPFWSVGFAWNVDREAWWNIDGTMKVRGSVGDVGTVNFAADQAITQYKYDADYEYNGYIGAQPSKYGNPGLKWQSTRKYNVGIDLALLNNFIVFNYDFYVEKTQNLLLDIDVAPSTGFSSYKENMGSLRNIGMNARLRLNMVRIPEQGLAWSVTLGAAGNRNKITSLSNALEAMNAQANELDNVTGDTPLRTYQVGRSQSSLMVVRSYGIDPATGNEIYVKRNGDLVFEYDANDKVYIGDTNPKVQGNVQTNLRYKGFDLNMVFQYEYGAVAYNSTLATKVEGTVTNTTPSANNEPVNPKYNADRRVLTDRWKEPGDIAMFRRIDDVSQLFQTSRLVQDNNFFTLSSLSLSYEVPQLTLRKTFIERLKFTFSTTDLFRISTIKMERGTLYPFASTFRLGATITF